MESGFEQRVQRSSLAMLYLFNSFLVVIILFNNLKENCLSLLSLEKA